MGEKAYSLRGLVLYFLRLGTTGFGGPIVLTSHMHEDLVRERGWISESEYREGLAFSQLAPGPLAAQLAIYLGWVRFKVLGATLAGLAFILPSFLIVLVLAALYIRYQGLPFIQAAFYGIGASVIAIIAQSAYKLVKRTFGKDWLLWGIGTVSALITAVTESEMLWVFALAGIVAVSARRSTEPNALKSMIPAWLVSGLSGPAAASGLPKVFFYFFKAGLFVFGSGLAIVPFLHRGVVQDYHWLTERQFLDAVAVAMITPGPVVITVAFIGFLVAGVLGAFTAAAGVFLPVYGTVVVLAPLYKRWANHTRTKNFIDGVTAAAIGSIGGAAFVLGRRALFDLPTTIIAVVSLLILLKFKKLPEPLLIVMAGVVGFILKSRFLGS